MPSRIVREGIISSARINALSLGAEVLYRRLMSVTDDYGRFFGSVMNLRVSCFPTNPERFREKEVAKWLNELLRGDDPLVKTYAVAGITYLEVQAFGQQIRGKSKFPAPPWFINQQDSEEFAKQMISGQISKCEADVQPSRSRSRSRISYTESESESKEESNAPSGALSLVVSNDAPLDFPGVVRPDVPARQRKAGKRTTEEIKAALGPERLPWWEHFWGVYPCHEGMNPALDAYERKVHTRDLAVEIYNGARRYAEEIMRRRMSDPSTPVKYAQGWLNDERWKDEIKARDGPAPRRERSFVADVTEVITRNMQETGKPW
jgi:hypothetical protein